MINSKAKFINTSMVKFVKKLKLHNYFEFYQFWNYYVEIEKFNSNLIEFEKNFRNLFKRKI